MRYRKLTETGDYSFGRGTSQILENNPEAVAQAVKTRLALITGEWRLDLTEGTPYNTQVLGTNTRDLYDIAIQERINETQGLTQIVEYTSSIADRDLVIVCSIDTIYGTTQVVSGLFPDTILDTSLINDWLAFDVNFETTGS